MDDRVQLYNSNIQTTMELCGKIVWQQMAHVALRAWAGWVADEKKPACTKTWPTHHQTKLPSEQISPPCYCKDFVWCLFLWGKGSNVGTSKNLVRSRTKGERFASEGQQAVGNQ